MMSGFGRTIGFIAGLGMTALTTIQPTTAQTSGVGSDVYTRVMLKGYDSSIALLRLDKHLNQNAPTAFYGPYDGWVPIAMTVAADNYSYILWRRTDGLIDLWKVDPNLHVIADTKYGPFYGSTAESFGVDTDGSSYLRLIWRNTEGRLDVWCVDPNLVYCGDRAYGPYLGFDPGEGGILASAEILAESAAYRAAQAKAAAAMTTDTASAPTPHETVKPGSH
jgi:hypothetical protein